MQKLSNYGRVEVIHRLVDVATAQPINEVYFSLPSNGYMNIEQAQELINNLQEAVEHGRSLLE